MKDIVSKFKFEGVIASLEHLLHYIKDTKCINVTLARSVFHKILAYDREDDCALIEDASAKTQKSRPAPVVTRREWIPLYSTFGINLKHIDHPVSKDEVEKKAKDDPTNPNHYKQLPIECREVTQHFNFFMGNVVKYIWRSRITTTTEDLKKAVWYVNAEIRRREDGGYVIRKDLRIQVSDVDQYFPLYLAKALRHIWRDKEKGDARALDLALWCLEEEINRRKNM